MNGKKHSVRMTPLRQDDDLYSEWGYSDGGSCSKVESDHRNYILRKIMFIAICFSAVVLSIGLAVTIGQYSIGFFESYGLIWDHIWNGPPEDPMLAMKDHVVWNLRLPRIIVAVISGAGLAVAGAVMQSVLKNPLADPYTTGISSGAAFGATLALAYGTSLFSGDLALVGNAFIFSLIPTGTIILISYIRKVSPTSMILAGIAVMYIFNALTTVLKLWADPEALSDVYRWQVGTLEGLQWMDIPTMFVVVLLGSVLMMILSSKINVLSMGDDGAKSLGLNTSQLRIFCLAVVSLMSAAVVSFTGVIGFVGLVSPHVVRIFIGADNKYLIPASAFFGSVLLLVADVIGRVIIAPATLQVGVVTAFLGGPLFLYLIIRSKKEVW